LEFPYAFKADSVADLILGGSLPVNNYKVGIPLEPYGYSIFKLTEAVKKDE